MKNSYKQILVLLLFVLVCPVPLSSQTQPERLELVIMVDRSGNMRGEPLTRAVEITGELVDQVDIGASVSLVSFNHRPTVLQDMKKLKTPEDKKQVLETLHEIYGQGGSLYGRAFAAARKQFSTQSRVQKACILISDGLSDGDDYRSTLTDFRKRNIPVFPIAIGPNRDLDALKEIATETDGEYYRSKKMDSAKVIRDLFRLVDARFTFVQHTGILTPSSSNDELLYTGLDGLLKSVKRTGKENHIRVRLTQQSDNASLELSNPAGKRFGRQTVDQHGGFTYRQANNDREIILRNPEPGDWRFARLRVSSHTSPPASGIYYRISASIPDEYPVHLHGLKSSYNLGDQPVIGIHVPVNLKPEEVLLQFKSPDEGETVSFKLNDQGKQGDQQADDRIFSTDKLQLDTPGLYRGTARVLGKELLSGDKNSLRRRIQFSFVVGKRSRIVSWKDDQGKAIYGPLGSPLETSDDGSSVTVEGDPSTGKTGQQGQKSGRSIMSILWRITSIASAPMVLGGLFLIVGLILAWGFVTVGRREEEGAPEQEPTPEPDFDVPSEPAPQPTASGSVWDQDVITIGRSSQCDIVLDHDSISSLHATLTRKGEEWLIRDNNSTNGIVIDEEKVSEAQVDESTPIRLGHRKFTIQELQQNLSSS